MCIEIMNQMDKSQVLLKFDKVKFSECFSVVRKLIFTYLVKWSLKVMAFVNFDSISNRVQDL